MEPLIAILGYEEQTGLRITEGMESLFSHAGQVHVQKK